MNLMNVWRKCTREIVDKFYGVTPSHGYCYGQDEDQGQLGAWYVLTSLELFDVKGLTGSRPIIQFSSPIVDEVKIKLGNDKELVIKTVNDSSENVYVNSIKFNGESIDKNWI